MINYRVENLDAVLAKLLEQGVQQVGLLTISGAAHQSFAEYPEIVVTAVRVFFGGQWPKGIEKVTKLDTKTGN